MRDAVPGMGAGRALPSPPGFFVCLRRDSRVVGEQEGERQGGEPQYLAGQYRRSGVMGKGVRHLACRAGAALGGRGSALRGRARCGGGRDFWEESRCVPGADECGAVTFRSWMGPSRAAGGWSGSRRSADGAGQALPDLGRTRTQVACRLQAVLRPGFPASLGRSPRAAAGGQGAARQAGARLWRLAAVLAVLTCGLLASAAAVPAAFATMLPDEGPQPWASRRRLPLSSRISWVAPHVQAHARRSARAAGTPP